MMKFNLTKIEMDDMVSTMASADGVEKEFNLQPPVQQPELWDDLDDCDTNESIEIEVEDEYEDDGQPSEYDEWQDYYGGDDSIYEHDCDCMFDN
tara:strand:+ start:194 stop:475 length:282 start_codon:yes stop_codon:yes gene_type:complete